MKRYSLIRWSVPALVIVAASLSGCSWFHRDRVDYYKGAAETRPLEVPPDLDTPSSSKELVVPGPGGAGAQIPASAAVQTAGTNANVAPPGAASSAADLHVADSVDHAWQRVGLALDRAQIGTLTSRDQSGHTYTMDFDGSVTTTAEAPPAPEHHWYSRILHPFGGSSGASAAPAATTTQRVTSALRINVSEDNGGARVSVIGNPNDKSAPEAARRVIEILRERLS